MAMESAARKVLLVGWDAADWELITPLLEAGQMPCLERLIDRGVKGDLAAPQPLVAPLLWTSIATGRRADAHGVLGEVEPDPETGGVRPVSGTSRAVKALWNILHQVGRTAHVVGWPATHPAEPVRGACVSDRFPEIEGPRDQPWPPAPGAVHPARLEDVLGALRVHPGDLHGAHLLPFVPGAARIDQRRDGRLATLAAILAECLSIHAAATWILEHEPWDFLAVHYAALGRAGPHFLPYHPPRLEGIAEADFALYRDVMGGLYRFHDMMLERLLQLAGPEAAVVLVSGHGLYGDARRPVGGGRARPATPEEWRHPTGILCLAGPPWKRDELIHGASALDVAPTVLHLLGLPVGEDLEGAPLLDAFREPRPPSRIPSWERVPGESGRHPAGPAPDPSEVQAALEGLAALGYLDGPTAQERQASLAARRQQTFHLAVVHFDAGRFAEAAPLFERLSREEPEEATFALFLAGCRFALGQFDECRRLALDVLRRAPDRAAAELILGQLAHSGGRDDEALDHLRRAERAEENWPDLLCLVGVLYLRMRRWEDAGRAFVAAEQADPACVRAHLGLALAMLEQGRPEEAAGAALDAIGHQFRLPEAHHLLGMALARLGRPARATRALQTCLALQPDHAGARELLAALQGRAPRVASSITCADDDSPVGPGLIHEPDDPFAP